MTSLSLHRLKELGGVLVKDSTRYIPALFSNKKNARGDSAWVSLRNRREQLSPNPEGPGVACDFPYSSRLHACDVLPAVANRLFLRALKDWPIEFGTSLSSADSPKVSFLFAHRGTDRLQQLIRVIQSIMAQRDVPVEIIVADLTRPSLQNQFPAGVHHIALDDLQLAPGWRKSWAFNVAAREASGEILVFQDGDLCVPRDYASQLVRWMERGNWQAVSMQRFLFYLSEEATSSVLQSGCWPRGGIEAVTQNWKGGTIAIRRDCFFDIGGFDEGFVDWGGEDDEFFDRCTTLRHWKYGYLPFVHLWHPPQAVRKVQANRTISEILPQRLGLARDIRIQELASRNFGTQRRPDPMTGYCQASSTVEVGR